LVNGLCKYDNEATPSYIIETNSQEERQVSIIGAAYMKKKMVINAIGRITKRNWAFASCKVALADYNPTTATLVLRHDMP
jgi:hypothetical protein